MPIKPISCDILKTVNRVFFHNTMYKIFFLCTCFLIPICNVFVVLRGLRNVTYLLGAYGILILTIDLCLRRAYFHTWVSRLYTVLVVLLFVSTIMNWTGSFSTARQNCWMILNLFLLAQSPHGLTRYEKQNQNIICGRLLEIFLMIYMVGALLAFWALYTSGTSIPANIASFNAGRLVFLVNSNTLGIYAGISVALSFFNIVNGFVTKRNSLIRWCVLVGELSVAFIVLSLTQSRAGTYFLTITIFLFIMSFLFVRKYRSWSKAIGITILAFLVAFASIYFSGETYLGISKYFIEKKNIDMEQQRDMNKNRDVVVDVEPVSRLQESPIDSTLSLRTFLWEDAYELIKSHLFWGIGAPLAHPNAVIEQCGGNHISASSVYGNSHNQLIHLLLSNGLLVTVLLVWCIMYMTIRNIEFLFHGAEPQPCSSYFRIAMFLGLLFWSFVELIVGWHFFVFIFFTLLGYLVDNVIRENATNDLIS